MDDMDDDDDVFCILYYEVCMINTVLRTFTSYCRSLESSRVEVEAQDQARLSKSLEKSRLEIFVQTKPSL